MKKCLLFVLLFVTTAVGFYVAVILFKNLLQISLSLQPNELMITLILAIISYILIAVKRSVYKRKNI